MKVTRKRPLFVATPLLAVLFFAPAAVKAEPRLVAVGQIPAEAHDLSGLKGALEDGTPADRLGGLGSAIDYTGKDDLYLAASDRGPADGVASYLARVHYLRIRPRLDSASLEIQLVSTLMLSDEQRRPLIGIASAFHPTDPALSLRYDAEGVRVMPDGSFFLGEEYGPSVDQFNPQGVRIRRFPIPAAFAIQNPSASKDEEISRNTSGRVANKGFEGLALSPDRKTLFALLQAPLIQDHAKSGRFCRVLRIDIETGKTTQWAYPLDAAGLGCNEMLAVDADRFLVIERDGKIGAKAAMKNITLADASEATDVSGIEALPEKALPPGHKPLRKRVFIDMLDPRHKLAGESFPEKIEGLTFGPNLPDGRRTLLVTSDNDFRSGQPSWFYLFAFPAEDLSPPR